MFKEAIGDLWEFQATWRGITTNGTIKKDGTAVMGRGTAAQAVKMYPRMPVLLGTALQYRGNRVYRFKEYRLFTFPVKYQWMEKADPGLIKKSADQLQVWAERHPRQTFVLPRPGCGNGRLSWELVRPLLVDLPANVTIIDRRMV